MIGWKEVQFCDSVLAVDPQGHNQSDSLFDSSDLQCIKYANDLIYTGFRDGTVKVFNNKFELVYNLHSDLNQLEFIFPIVNTKLVLLVSSSTGSPLQLQVYKLDSNPPQLHAHATVNNQTNTYPLTAMDVWYDLSVLGLGFGDGSVVILRGDLLHDRGTRQRHIYTAPTSITNLCLVGNGDQLFVSSVDQIAVLSTSVQKPPLLLEKTRGADLNCMARIGASDDVIVAQDSGLFVYNTSHKKNGIELNCRKRQLQLSKDGRYAMLSVLHLPNQQSLLSKESLRAVLIDLELKIICFNGLQTSNVRAMFEGWDKQFVILNAEYEMIFLNLKLLALRIQLLVSQNSFQMAIRLAILENAGDDQVCHLHSLYADYMLTKNDFEGALNNFILGIRRGHTSNAIQKFKNSHHADLLSKYLTALIEKGCATPQHLTLQTICLTKLEKFDELEVFLESAVHITGFEFNECINVLLDTSNRRCALLASKLAKELPDPDLAVQIMLRTLNDGENVLQYVQTLQAADALRILVVNARRLLEVLPEETTWVLIKLFTGRHGAADNDEGISGTANTTGLAGLSYLPPKPRLIFPAFTSHTAQFIRFLNAVINYDFFVESQQDMCDLATSLFGSYIRVKDFTNANNLLSGKLDYLRPVETLLSTKLAPEFVWPPNVYAKLMDDVPSAFIWVLKSKHYELAAEFMFELKLFELGVHAVINDEGFINYLRKADKLNRFFSSAFQCIPPPHLIRLLGTSQHLTVGDLNPVLLNLYASTEEIKQRNQKLIESYKSEIEERSRAIEKQNAEFQNFSTKCQLCDLVLTVPMTQFSCSHAYHKQCLSQDQCPKCSPEQESLKRLREASLRSAAHEEFVTDQIEANPTMSTIADLISRGAL